MFLFGLNFCIKKKPPVQFSYAGGYLYAVFFFDRGGRISFVGKEDQGWYTDIYLKEGPVEGQRLHDVHQFNEFGNVYLVETRSDNTYILKMLD